MRTVIIAGGQPHAGEGWRRWVQQGDRIIGVDGGASQALAWGLVPHVVIGDLDSLPSPARAVLEARGGQFLVHPRAKDETDLELALSYAAEQGADDIVILGALGGRLDHTLANVLLLALPQLARRSVRIVDGLEEALLLRSGQDVLLRGLPGDLVSLLPLGGDAHGVTATGLAWPLRNETLRFAFSRGVSNEMTGAEATVVVHEGLVLVVHRHMVVEEERVGHQRGDHLASGFAGR